MGGQFSINLSLPPPLAIPGFPVFLIERFLCIFFQNEIFSLNFFIAGRKLPDRLDFLLAFSLSCLLPFHSHRKVIHLSASPTTGGIFFSPSFPLLVPLSVFKVGDKDWLSTHPPSCFYMSFEFGWKLKTFMHNILVRMALLFSSWSEAKTTFF